MTDYSKVTRVQVISQDGTCFLGHFEPGVTLDVQDDGKTLKIWCKTFSKESALANREAFAEDMKRILQRRSLDEDS